MKYRIAISLVILMSACSDSSFKGGVATAPAPVPVAVAPVKTSTTKQSAAPAASANQTASGQTASIPAAPAISQLQLACANAAASLKVFEQTVSYAARTACAFGQHGNLDKLDLHIQAQETSTQVLTLPTGSICEIGIETIQGAQLHYDDMFVFTLNDFMLFANSVFLKDQMLQENGVARWDFERVKGAKPDSFGGTSYCIGGTCKIPNTDETGEIDIKLDPSTIAPIAVAISGQKSVTMNLTAMGDNDEGVDCSHSALDLKVTFKYIP